MTNRAELLANGKVSQTVSLPDQSQFTSAMVPNLAFGENINTSSSEDMDIIDSTEDDESIYNFGEECENVIDEIEGTTPSLVFDFSQPLPVPSNNDKKNLAFMQLIQEFEISCQAHEKILLECFSDIKAGGYDICIRGCMQFNNENDIACIKCGEARYKNGQTSESDTRVPVRLIVQLPLARQLALCSADDKTRAEMLYHHNHQSSQDGQKADVFDGHVYQSMKHLFSGENDIAILLSMDRFNPHNVPGSVTIVHATVLNLNSTIRYEKNRMIQIAMLPSCTGPSDIWSFLESTLRNLHLLRTEGMEVKTPTTTIRAKVHVLMATDNILALAKLACHVGHTSKNGCRICHVVGQTPKHGQYFRMLPGTQTRSLESFRNYNLASSEDRKGLNSQLPLASMETFSGPFFFALDEMHGLCHGIGKQVWGLVYRKYGIKHPLCLSLATQREIGAAIVAAKSTIPTSLHGAWRDMTKNVSFFRAVDWADFLLFVVPTLVAEHVQDLVAPKCITWPGSNMQFTHELGVISRESNLNKKSLLSTADIDIGMFTINQHIIQHYLQMIDLYDPPRAYSTRSVERAIGEYSKSIKSNSQVSVNAGNIMIRLAQSRRVAELTTVANTKTPPANLLVYSAYTNGWPVTEGGDPANAECEIEFWGFLKNLTIFDSFEDRSHLSLLLKTFYDLKGEECSMLEPSIKTSRKTYLNGCIIDAAFNQSSTREACHVHVQLQVDMNSRRSRSYCPGYKHFFGKIVIFFQHVHNSKRWPLALITIYSVHLKNGLPITSVVKPKTIMIHASDIVELVGLVPSNVNGSHYIIWPSLKRGPKLTLGALIYCMLQMSISTSAPQHIDIELISCPLVLQNQSFLTSSHQNHNRVVSYSLQLASSSVDPWLHNNSNRQLSKTSSSSRDSQPVAQESNRICSSQLSWLHQLNICYPQEEWWASSCAQSQAPQQTLNCLSLQDRHSISCKTTKLGSLGWILNLKKLSLKLSQQLENFDYLLETQTMTIKLSGTKLCNLYQLIHQHITSVSPIFPSDLQPFHENSDHNNWSVSSPSIQTVSDMIQEQTRSLEPWLECGSSSSPSLSLQAAIILGTQESQYINQLVRNESSSTGSPYLSLSLGHLGPYLYQQYYLNGIPQQARQLTRLPPNATDHKVLEMVSPQQSLIDCTAHCGEGQCHCQSGIWLDFYREPLETLQGNVQYDTVDMSNDFGCDIHLLEPMKQLLSQLSIESNWLVSAQDMAEELDSNLGGSNLAECHMVSSSSEDVSGFSPNSGQSVHSPRLSQDPMAVKKLDIEACHIQTIKCKFDNTG
ncbi:hypothetical protein PHYBLDRAFT_142568 [Phycomyces blakesleeanus NRRL 1555(-)]|uniref:Uncharacterized protein n=1 Tax=Phycomyces blakesleeanus (strain ATCC 8743b / DSM 1359 / FGSC 10004 / NBRC 33097 / NRRL 1555) TaxID=763407 RepID=A0A162XXB8_PHYB8|nr:hypothetical protein PHYBLDRAFT_142568 [Phycomyces blakesleeanus NRRL 1555(-)]OAD77055.1 hypothetical protein PHYBLDRAFT_142568 [Phycomyces blakesleeanus NRRL 1555(-)]|eukprot:XP_018295095.1 hypothetical protein PHYBLDRAFT_142568 [Phycomyces blakesleeanus NRRL 1555(-)]